MVPDDELSDEELVLHVQRGDVTAYDQLILRYQKRIYSAIYNMTSNHEDTNDLLMETFDKAFRSINHFKKDSSFYTWIYRIAVNRTINHLQRFKKFKRNMSLNDVDLDLANSLELLDPHYHSNPEKSAALLDLQKKLNECLQKLSEEHRATVVLHDIEGLNHGEIGKIMNCTEGTVRSRLHYAHRNLQNLLSNYLNEEK